MRKTAATITALALFLLTQSALAALSIMKLPPPELAKGKPVMQALKERKSVRQLSDKKLSPQQLSELLWAADGLNRQAQRTAPSAFANYAVDIYVVLQEGVYLYEPERHQLVPVAEGDYRKQVGRQDFVYIAPVNLVFVVDLERFKKGPSAPNEEHLRQAYIEAGAQAQNVYLYCASEGLGATVRTSIDREKFGRIVKLRPSQDVLAAQTVGYPK